MYQSFRDLVVWQQSFDFAKSAYALTKTLPTEDKYGVASHLCRAAVAMPAHIAEGQRKRGKDFIRCLNYANGNSAECETYLLLLQELHPKHAEELQRLKEANTLIQKLLSSLIYSMEHPKPKEVNVQSAVERSIEPVVVPVAA
ncbi:MAG: four helix bundle protein [Patescibacteria group bacterium]|nr:four helix bundle protein [Patescibacteria group bacterium]